MDLINQPPKYPERLLGNLPYRRGLRGYAEEQCCLHLISNIGWHDVHLYLEMSERANAIAFIYGDRYRDGEHCQFLELTDHLGTTVRRFVSPGVLYVMEFPLNPEDDDGDDSDRFAWRDDCIRRAEEVDDE